MYGKYFASTFTGSMFGAGCEVFAVWGYVIANAVDSTVELNADYLSAVLGTPTERIAAAITRLCSPDPKSRTPDKHGVRLEHLNGFTYHVVNHAIYRALRNEEERRVYNREAKRKERAKVKPVVNDKHTLSKMSAYTEAEAKTDTKAHTEAKKQKTGPTDASTDARSKRPIFKSTRFVVFEWQLDDLRRLLGPSFDAFDVHAWFFDLGSKADAAGLVIPQRDGGKWLQEQTLAEAVRRGLPVATAAAGVGKTSGNAAAAARFVARGQR